MHLSLVTLGVLLAGIADLHAVQYKLPTIYTPDSPSMQTWPYTVPYMQSHQVQSAHSPAMINYITPIAPAISNAMPNYHPAHHHQPQPQPQSLYPPNSLILVYYRPKPVTPAPPMPQKQPRVEVPAHRFSEICKAEGIIPHPDDCLKFIRCKLSLRHQVYYYEERTCPQGLAFDSKLESCNYQFRVAGCKSKYTQSHTHLTTSQTQSLPTQTLLTYHGELPEPNKDTGDMAEETSNPSLYMMDLPQPLSDVSDDTRKQEQPIEDREADIASVPLAGKNADSGLKTAPATKTVKKPASTKKSPARKVVSKRPTSGTKSPQGTKSKPVVQQKESIEPSRKQQQISSFSIGDSNEYARMILDKETEPAPVFEQPASVDAESSSYAAIEEVVPAKPAPGVRYADENVAEEENYSSPV